MAEVSRYHRVYKLETGETLIYFKQNINNTSEYLVGCVGGTQQDEIPGIKHFLEHMLHQATPNVTVEERAEFAADTNTYSNAFTTEDYLMFYTNVPNTFLDTTMELDAEFLFNDQFKREDIDNERLAIDEEINSNEDSNSFVGFVSDYQISRMRGSQILGTHEDIAKIDEQALKKHIKEHFVAENLVMVVKSNLEFDEVREKFEKYFAHKVPSNKAKRYIIKTPKYYPPQNIMQYQIDPAQKTVSINVAYRTSNNDIENELYAFVFDYIFNNGFHGRLLNKLRTENGLVYSSSYYPMAIKGGMQYCGFELTTSRNKVNQTLEVFGQIIKDLCENGITQVELDKLKNQTLIAEIDRATGKKDENVFNLLDRYLSNRELFYNNQLHNIKNLTVAEVNNYLKRIFDQKNIVLLMNGDIDFANLYTDQEILELFNAHQSKYLYNPSDKTLYDYKTGKKIAKKQAKEILSKMTQAGFAKDVTMVNAFNDDQMTDLDLSKLGLEERLSILSDLAKQLGLNLDFNIELPKTDKEQDEVPQEPIKDAFTKTDDDEIEEEKKAADVSQKGHHFGN